MTNNNFLIDALDTLTNSATDGEMWLNTHKLIDDIGGKHIISFEMLKEEQIFLWARTSMSDAWIEEYLANEYYLVSPIIRDGLLSSRCITYKCGDAVVPGEENVGLAQMYNQGLRIAGYSELRAQSFSTEDSSTTLFISLCFEDNKDTMANVDNIQVTQAQALISEFQKKPRSDKSAGITKVGAYSLSVVEKDALSYLGQGMEFSQISEKLGITEATTTTHFKSAQTRLKATTPAQALARALTSGAVKL